MPRGKLRFKQDACRERRYFEKDSTGGMTAAANASMIRNFLCILHGQSELAAEAFEGCEAVPALLQQFHSPSVFLTTPIPV